MKSQSNPTMREDKFERPMYSPSDVTGYGTMTLKGTINKIGIMLAIVTAAAVVGWNIPNVFFLILAFVGGLGLAFWLYRQPEKSSVLAPFYAVISGLAVGTISVFSQEMLKDSAIGSMGVPIAILGTLVTLGVMLFLFAKRIIVVTDTMRSIIIGATAAVAITYVLAFCASFIFPSFVGGLAIFNGGPIGIAFSIFVIGLAAFNFLLDFDLIERGVKNQAPAYMEWYAAFGMTVTIVWLYLEILRLLRRIFGSR